ncbi:MAG: acyltransferase [Meiothermus sp.]|uniref:acyltransferase n=1 Tax=Meiothermus sp. TaxID=1955249 RepID=UPI0025DD5E72|nr:acyltransferase [Meiothermus sp.]MCS7058623.1 acyltransferase [Meiothermus sp.]MCS7194702.1 acyltransferase [Meiothermus sp.]MCX7739713.1 acyltransferase [Meiothermus sp.]MDW8090543.1 acyltransferase [Meiothermus sp.]
MPAPPRPAQAEPDRFPWVEVFRGLAILEVLFHHLSGRFLRMMEQGSAEWFLLVVLNRVLHFAVPAFLFLTTVVLGAALIRGFHPLRYAQNRLLRVVWPYLLWSGLYLLWRYHEFPQWFDPGRIPHQLLWGKAYFHLYFLVLAIQLTLLLPLLLPLLRWRLPFWGVMLGGGLLTLGVYFFNREVYRFEYPGSVILWYLPAIALGVWLAGQLERLDELLRRGRLAALGVVAVGLAFYLPNAVEARMGLPVNTMAYQVGHWLYTTAMAFLLLGLAVRLSGSPLAPFLRLLGRYSLQIYLIHPLVMRLLERTPGFPEPLGFVPAFAIYGVLALGLPLGLAWLVRRSLFSRWMFGR